MTSVVEQLRAKLKAGDPDAAKLLPYAEFMGIRLERVDGDVRGRLVYSDHLVGNPTIPALHGGTLGALMEMTAACKLLAEAQTDILPRIVTITVQYLRSGKPVDTFARSIITKQGRRVVNVRSEAWQEDPARPIASADAHFLVVG
jgi:acyl-coenzyme A thioesterase PaaI-like protein